MSISAPGCAGFLTAALLAGCGTATTSADDDRGTNARRHSEPDSPVVMADGEALLTCGATPPFAVSALDGGVPGLADESEVAAALTELGEEAGIDAPPELQHTSGSEAEWIVLGAQTERGTRELAMGVGRWDPDTGPVGDAMYVVLARAREGWDAVGWGTCQLEPALKRGHAWVELTAPVDGLDRTGSSITVQVQERECTSSRDPTPHLHEPYVVERAHSVTVYWTSEPILTATCPGNPRVPGVLGLDRPLGDRTLFDGSTWPPRPVGRR